MNNITRQICFNEASWFILICYTIMTVQMFPGWFNGYGVGNRMYYPVLLLIIFNMLRTDGTTYYTTEEVSGGGMGRLACKNNEAGQSAQPLSRVEKIILHK